MNHSFSQSRPHPWHGLEVGPEPPALIWAYIEITPFDVIKYEVHKPTGYTMVDRPQLTSASPPTLYGFIPRTYCADRVRDLSPGSDARRRRPARCVRDLGAADLPSGDPRARPGHRRVADGRWGRG